MAQLGAPGWTSAAQQRTASAILDALANEREPAVINSMGIALGHLRDVRAVSAMVCHKGHPDADVRFAVVLALSTHAHPLAVQTLVELSGDPDEDVRNWATFSLGSQLEEVDSPELRDALAARLEDAHSEVRGEALVGLAHRKDGRVLEPLRRAFLLDGRRGCMSGRA